MPAGLRRNEELANQLVLRQSCLEIASKQIGHGDEAFTALSEHAHACTQGDKDRRQIHVRIAVRQTAANGRDIAHAHVG